MARAGFRDRPLAASRPGGVLGWDQAEIARELLGVCECGDIPDLCDEADRGERVDAAQTAKAPNDGRPRPLDRLFEDQRVQAIAAGEQHLVMGQILTEDDFKQWLFEANLAQPFQVTLSPRRARTAPEQPLAQ